MENLQKEYFKRQIDFWGEATQSKLLEKKIAIIGSGGLGCSLGVALGSSGVGEIYLVDFDEVSFHNIHRQIVFTPQDVGKAKSVVLGEYLEKRSPFVKINSMVCDFEEFSKKFIQNNLDIDLILDATDNFDTRSQIDQFCKNNNLNNNLNLPWIYASVEGYSGQVCFFDKSSFASFASSPKKPQGVAAPMVMQVASFEANIALRFLCGEKIEKDTLFYLYYDSNGLFNIQKFKMAS